MSKSANELRDEISPVELFFDLVFIFAMTQLSAHLLHHLTWRGAAETTVMLVAVFSVWSYTSFDATLIRVRRRRTLWMILVAMLAGLFMNAAITRAFTTEPWAFVLPFLLVHVGRPFWTIATAPTRLLRNHYLAVLGWVVAMSPLWIIGATVDAKDRLFWWGAAAVIDQIATWLAHPIPGRRLHSESIEFDAGHLVERCRLFLIIAMGEAVLTTGFALTDAPPGWMTFLTGTCALATVVALWALYFAGSDHLLDEHVGNTDDPLLAGRVTIGSEVIVVAGLIALAVGNEYAIVHPHDNTSLGPALLLFGGPLLYLLVQTTYLARISQTPSTARVVGLAALVIGGAVALTLPLFASLVVVTLILAAIVTAALNESRTPV